MQRRVFGTSDGFLLSEAAIQPRQWRFADAVRGESIAAKAACSFMSRWQPCSRSPHHWHCLYHKAACAAAGTQHVRMYRGHPHSPVAFLCTDVWWRHVAAVYPESNYSWNIVSLPYTGMRRSNSRSSTSIRTSLISPGCLDVYFRFVHFLAFCSIRQRNRPIHGWGVGGGSWRSLANRS
jgi:hypothetical protein